jgi:hypothetical protein
MSAALRIHDLKDAEGRTFAFEIERGMRLDRRRLYNRIRAIPGVEILRAPKAFSWFREEEFCEFSLAGVHFVVWEPFGDSSRYWIGPKDKAWHAETGIVRERLS